MATTRPDAIDEIKGVLTTYWNENILLAIPELVKVPEIIYGDSERKEGPEDKSNRTVYCRLFIKHTGGKQTTMAGPDGKAIYTNTGEITIQCFAAFKKSADEATAGRAADVAKKAYTQRSHTRKVWYREARYEEIGSDGPWYQTNVKAKFTWDELR